MLGVVCFKILVSIGNTVVFNLIASFIVFLSSNLNQFSDVDPFDEPLQDRVVPPP